MAILQRSFFKAIRQPGFIFTFFLELIFIAAIIFAVKVQTSQGTVVTVLIFGKDLPVGLFMNEFLPNFIGLILNGILFLYILTSSTVAHGLLNDPLVKIVLASSVSRRRIYFNELGGFAFAGYANIFAFYFLSFLIVAIKAGDFYYAEFISGMLSFSFLLTVFLAMSIIFGMITENTMGSVILVLLTHYLASNLLYTAKGNGDWIVKVGSLIIPATIKVQEVSTSLVLGKTRDIEAFVQPSILAVVFTIIAYIIFKERDF